MIQSCNAEVIYTICLCQFLLCHYRSCLNHLRVLGVFIILTGLHCCHGNFLTLDSIQTRFLILNNVFKDIIFVEVTPVAQAIPATAITINNTMAFLTKINIINRTIGVLADFLHYRLELALGHHTTGGSVHLIQTLTRRICARTTLKIRCHLLFYFIGIFRITGTEISW